MESRNLTRADQAIADLAEEVSDTPTAVAYREDDPTIEYGVDFAAPPGTPLPATRIGIGARIRGRYVLESVIGIGGTAIVYRARDVRRERGAPFAYVAVKIPRPGSSEALKREFRTAQILPHPNIVRVFDLDRVADTWFMVTELLEGEPLAASLERHTPGPLPPSLAGRVLRGCSAALQFAHERGIVHGDFKPGNVLIPHTGEVRVLDFGTSVAISPPADASAAAPGDHTAPPAATRRYASPQVLAGERPEVRDDVFSFACVAYEVLAGAHPFGRRSSTEARIAGVLPTAPAVLNAQQWQVLSHALAWERESRPSSVLELTDALGARAGGFERPPHALPVERGRTRPPAPIITAALVALLAIPTLLLWMNRGGNQSVSGATATAAVRAETARGEDPAAPRAGPGAATSDPPPAASASDAPGRSAAAAQPATGESIPAAEERRRSASPTPSEISFETELQTVSEGAAAAAVMLTRARSRAGTVQVRWRTISETAGSPGDYEAIAAGVARFADGQTRRVLYIPLRPDEEAEGAETFAIELYSPSRGARIAPIGLVTVRIDDDD